MTVNVWLTESRVLYRLTFFLGCWGFFDAALAAPSFLLFFVSDMERSFIFPPAGSAMSLSSTEVAPIRKQLASTTRQANCHKSMHGRSALVGAVKAGVRFGIVVGSWVMVGQRGRNTGLK